MKLTNQLILVARAYADHRGLSLSRVSTLVFNDGKKLDGLVDGKDLATSRFENALAWFSSNWPDGAVWPADVPRPDPSLSEAAPEFSSVA